MTTHHITTTHYLTSFQNRSLKPESTLHCSACSLYAFASQTYGDETTTLIWTVYQWVVTTEPSSSMRCNGAKRGGGADQVQGNLVSLDDQSPAAKRKLQWPVAKRKAWCDFFCKWTWPPVDLLWHYWSAKKQQQLNRSVSVMQNQTKCERSMQEIINTSGNCTYNEIIVV